MDLWQDTRFVWWPRDLHKSKVLISMKPSPLLHGWNQFWIVLVIATIEDLEVHQMDIKILSLWMEIFF
jgi:hypothetical protein